jgi:hypothetical protein
VIGARYLGTGVMGHWRGKACEVQATNLSPPQVLQQISTNVFLIPPPRGQSDMLQNLMGSLFGGGR